MDCEPQTGNFTEMQQFSNFEFCVDDDGNYLVRGPSWGTTYKIGASNSTTY